MAPTRLIFVYNADGGIANGLIDAVHKLVSPSTYACSLCAITYGALRMDPRWKAWLAAQPFATEFWHRDDRPRALPATALPAVFAEEAGRIHVLLSADQLAATPDVDTLIAAIETAIRA